MIAENVKLAFSSMVQNKMRTLLSLMGIVIGVASVVAILNLGQSVTDSMLESMAAGGLDMLTITPRGAARETEIFTDEFSDTLMRNVSGILICCYQERSGGSFRRERARHHIRIL